MKRWYVVQVYAGYEEPIKKDLMRRVKEEVFGRSVRRNFDSLS